MFIKIWKLLHSPICTHHSVSPDVGFRGNALQPVFCIESPRGTAGNTSFYKASSGNENESSANSDTIRSATTTSKQDRKSSRGIWDKTSRDSMFLIRPRDYAATLSELKDWLTGS
jgi:hypothetical protein